VIHLCFILRCDLKAFAWFTSSCSWQNNFKKYELLILVFSNGCCYNVVNGDQDSLAGIVTSLQAE